MKKYTHEKAHEEIDYIFKTLLPQRGMAERPEQIRLCHSMLDAMLDGSVALCDAGTGIGKTFAYLVAGILLTTKLLEKLMNEHPRPTFLVILGFILGSLLELYPGIPAGSEIIICMIALVLGFGIIKYISSKDN